MISFAQVRDFLSKFCNESKEIADGIDNLIPYIEIVAGVTTGSPVLTLAGTIQAATKATKGMSSILSVLSKPKFTTSDSTVRLSNQERFDICFHLLCQNAYAQALSIISEKYKLNEFKAVKGTSGEQHFSNHPDITHIDTSCIYAGDISRGAEKLFYALNQRIRGKLLSQTQDYAIINTIIDEIYEFAKKEIIMMISDPESPYEWIRNYAYIQPIMEKPRFDLGEEYITKILKQALENFTDDNFTKGNKESWDKYREWLKLQVNEPIFGSGEYGIKQIGIKDLFIPPSFQYYRAGNNTNKTDGKSISKYDPVNLFSFLGKLISNRSKHWDLIFVFGDPGIGKTSSAQMFASCLANAEAMHPIYIPLKKINPQNNFSAEIENYLADKPLAMALDGLSACSNLIFILDGFDELAQATRERMGNFFRVLEDFKRRSKYHKASVIATGRDILFRHNATAEIPVGTHIISLEPFDTERVLTWCKKWKSHTGHSFDVTRFRQDKTSVFYEMTSQPLMGIWGRCCVVCKSVAKRYR